MSFDASDLSNVPVLPEAQLTRAEQALMTLKQRVVAQVDQQSRLKRFYREWQHNWLQQSEQIRSQMDELEARLAPWLPRENLPRLGVISRADEAA